MKYSKQDVEQRSSDYVCFKCGLEFLTEKDKKEDAVSTFFTSECGLCRELTLVTNIRNYNYLNIHENNTKRD